MPAAELEIQDSWDGAPLRERWGRGRDLRFVVRQLTHLPVELTALGASGKVLEVAAAEAIHSCLLATRGLDCWVVEPSAAMLSKARDHMAQFRVRLNLVRGIAETLPFPDRVFDRVLIDSALDHLAAPDAGVREMVRVLKPDGRLIVSFVNYASITVRVSRLWYRVQRLVNPAGREEHRFWDTPVPGEHTFECTYRNVGELCGQYLELERAIGVSMLWGAPGWARVLGRMSEERARTVLDALDRMARHRPRLADCVLMVWRPRRPGAPSGFARRVFPLEPWRATARPPEPRRVETMRVRPADPAYRWRAREDIAHVERWRRVPLAAARMEGSRPWVNRALTGDPARSWVDDLATRGPFGAAALVGSEDEAEVEAWLRAGASATLDVIGPNPWIPARLLGGRLPRRHGLAVVRADLNFVQLPSRHYDVILAAGAVSRVVNLEYLFDELAEALRPEGLLGLACYVGERRHQYAPERLAHVNAALRDVPARFRLDGVDTIGPEDTIASPLGAVRSDEIAAVAAARFDVVHAVWALHLFPLPAFLDVPALAREAPETLERLFARERALRDDPRLRPCWAYLVLRRRERPGGTAPTPPSC